MIETVPLFEGLSPAMLMQVESHAATRDFPRHAVVLSEGDEATSMFVILSGSLKVHHTDADGTETILNTLGPGQYFGELALVDDFARSASATTLEASRLLVLSKAAFRECLEKSPELAHNLLRALAREVRRLTETVNMMGRDVYGRIRSLLESMAVERGGTFVLEQPMTQQDIANRIASSREMVSRVLKELKAGGYIEEQDKRIVIKKKLPTNW
jgi:CRP/FNR family cyclic AMP-dependent transcriptional regulator